jgi:atypical dual specificity phosphatase
MLRIAMRILFWPTLGWNVMLGRILRVRPWWSHVEDGVILGALPFTSDVAALQAEGVRGVVNTCEEYAGPIEAYEKAGIQQLRLPTIDFTPPSLDDIKRGVEYIQQQVDSGLGVYVHCKAGRGRSATVVLCWLIATRRMTPETAEVLLIERRPHVNRRLAKRRVVREFYELAQGGPR